MKMKSTSKADVRILLRPEGVFCDQGAAEEFSTLKWIAWGSSTIELDGVSTPTPVQTDISMNQECWIAEAAKALIEFAFDAQMQGFGVNRRIAMESIRKALESI
jgi:hypothetical protein